MPHVNHLNKVEEKTTKLETHTSNFKSYYRVTVIKAVWYWHKNKHADQYSRIKSPEINPPVVNLIFNKSTRTTEWGKNAGTTR